MNTFHTDVFLLYTVGIFRVRGLPDTTRRARMRVMFHESGALVLREGWQR